ncbi:MAG: ABC transporter ATP-binding protein [Acidimicrobiales bacterium]|jgi:ATP-binding cassette subfamily B protein|nr:ABC transporter ATP-binding protein [Acidimicrobiales bacterium]
MFAVGGGFSPGSGPSSIQANAAAGLPHADVPGELREKVVAVLDEEPEHHVEDVPWTHNEWDRRPFGLVTFLWPHRWRLAGAVFLVLIETIALLVGPVLTQIGIDDGVRAGNRDVLLVTSAIYVVAVIVSAVLGFARVSYTGRLGERLNETLRIRVFSHMQRQGVEFHTEEKAGVLLTRMTSDIEALAVLFQEGIVNLLVQVFTLLVITAALFFYDPLLALVTLAVAIPPTLATSLWFRNVSAKRYLLVRDRIAALLSNLQESLAGIRVIAAHNRRAVNIARHRDVVGDHCDAGISAARANSTYAPITELIGICTQGTLLAVGGVMVANGRISVGEMAAFLLFLTSFFAPIQTLVQLYNSYQQGGAAIIKLRDLLGTEPSVVEPPDAASLPPIEGAIELRDVTFSYVPGRPVLRNVDLRIAPGETVAFVGETGAGKSTVARLLTRFHDPDSGLVTIDGHDLRDVGLTSLRSQLGVVPQEPFLFAGVVRDNVAFARPDATDEQLREALVAVGIDDLVERLGGLDAVVHERGASLSAGERQLLALARAFVARPRVLILDEATSNLDLHSESRVEKALDVVLEGRTAVIIAHRLATARRADRIAVVHDGEIVELGSHDELVQHEGRYASMHATWIAHGGAE